MLREGTLFVIMELGSSRVSGMYTKHIRYVLTICRGGWPILIPEKDRNVTI